MTNQNGLKAAFRALAGKNRLAKHYIKKKLAQDAGEHWVTVNAGSKEGGEGGGSHVLLDGEGRVIAGMGGKFKGQNIDRIERKKFINQNAWGRQRKALTEKAGNDTVLKRAVTAGMRSQAEKEADTSNDKWRKEGLYKAIIRKTLQENKGIINVLHDYVDRMNAKPKAQAEAKIAEGKQETPKVDRKSLIGQVNARHTMPMGDIIARKEQAITDKINSSSLSEADKKKYLDKLNSLTDEALKAGADSLDLYKVGVSYKKTNAESNAFNKMFSKQSEIDNLEKEINKKVQDNATQSKNKSILNSLNEAESAGAVYFKDANGKEFYRANAKSKTWNVANEYNKDALEKAKARQAKIDAGRPGHSATVGTVTDNVRDAINQKGDLQSAYATLKDQIAGLKEGTYVVNYRDGAVYRKTGNGLQYESSHFGWRDVDMKPEEFFKGNELHIGIGNTPEDAKANYKETEIMPLNHDYVASSVKAKLENSTGGHPGTALGLALMNMLNDIPAGTF